MTRSPFATWPPRITFLLAGAAASAVAAAGAARAQSHADHHRPRRAAQLRRARPDLEVVGIRGNVETRLARALGEDADLDAVVLAASGLLRLGRSEVISELLNPDVLLPAPAQGAPVVSLRPN